MNSPVTPRNLRKRMALYQRNKTMQAQFQVFLTIAAVAIFGAFAIRPSITSVARNSKELSELRDTRDNFVKKIETINNINQQLSEYEEEIELVDVALPGIAEEEEYLRQLEVIATQNKVLIKSVNFSEGESGFENVRKLSTTMSASGTYANTLAFIEDLQNLLRVSNLETVSFSPTNGTNIINTTMIIVTYYGG